MPTTQASARHGYAAPAVVRVGITTLRQLQLILDGEGDDLLRNALRLEIDHLITSAEESSWPL